MFVRKKKNSSGSISVQLISKNNNKYKLVETIGCVKNEDEVEQLLQKAKDLYRICSFPRTGSFDLSKSF